jgi:PAS domain S-box-containing protein
VATLDLSGRPLRVNPALEQLVGRSADRVEGHDWSDAVPLFNERGYPIPWEQSLPAQAVRERRVVFNSGYDLHLACSDGRRVPVSMTAAPLVVADKLAGAVVVLRDVSHEREVDQLKSSLVSTVSHELRTPLTMIQGFSELLLTRDDLGPVRSRDALERVHVSSKRLGRLIDDLLSVSRIESGKLTADLAPVALSVVIADVVASFEAQSGRQFLTEVDPELGPVLADQDKVLQVVTNLVSNAVKYSSVPSAIEIGACVVGDHAEISVTDHGIGMSEEEQSHLFERFARADRPEVRLAGGTGLGLYITKSLVELQNGQLWARSSRDRGSTFSVSLPLARAPGDAADEMYQQRDDMYQQRKVLEKALDR